MAQQSPESLGDFLPGAGEAAQATPPPASWPSHIPYPGRGTPLEDVPRDLDSAPPDVLRNMRDDMPDAAEPMPRPAPGEMVPRPPDQASPDTLNNMIEEMPQFPKIDAPQVRQILDEQKALNYGWRRTKLDAAEERRFRREMLQSPWYKNMEATFGGKVSLNDPSYDYRAAWKNGEVPTSGQQWPTVSEDGMKTYLSPSHPFAAKALVQRVTGMDVGEMHTKDFNKMLAEGGQALAREAQAAKEQQPLPYEAQPGHAVDQKTGRQIPLSPDPRDAVDPRPRPLTNNRMSGRLRQPEDEPGVLLAHHENSKTVTEPGTGEGKNVYGEDQGALAGKPLPFDKERYGSPEEAAAAASERSRTMPPSMEDSEMSEPEKRARAKGMEAGWLGGNKTATDAGKGPVRGFGPGGQYSKEEWDYIQGAPSAPAALTAPAAPAAPTAPVMPPAAGMPGAAPATVGQSRQTYMQQRLKDIEAGR